jgi:Initiator Replication protein
MTRKNKSHPVSIVSQPLTSGEQLKKSVGAIHSSGKLTLVQRKLANVLLYSAYDNLMSKRTHTVPVQIMCAMLGWEHSNCIDELKEALQALQKTTLEFNLREDGQDVWASMTMLSFAQIKGGVCTYRYDEALAERLFDPAMFAMINLEVQKRIDSAYALNLYENCIRYKDTNTGSTGWWSLELFREIVGATAAYCDDFRLLNRKVIKPAIERINKVSDVHLDVEYEKKNRFVVGVKFKVREKTDDEKLTTPNALPGLSLPESVDAYKELRDTSAFKALKKHGVAERLAFAWIREKGEGAVLEMVAYTEERDSQNLIKTNTRAYMTSLVKAGAEFNPSEYDKEKEAKVIEASTQKQDQAKAARTIELHDEFKKITALAAIKALTSEQHRADTADYIAEVGQDRAKSFSKDVSTFTSTLEKINFEIWQRKIRTPAFDRAAFDAWLVSKNINPKNVGDLPT